MKTFRKFIAEVKNLPVVKEDLASTNKKSIQAQGVPVKKDDAIADKVFRQWTGTYFGESVEPQNLQEGKSIAARLNFKKQGEYPKDSELKHVGYDPKKDELHISVNKNWTKVSPEVFRSWSGARRVNGKKHTGPRFNWLTNKEAGKEQAIKPMKLHHSPDYVPDSGERSRD